MLLILTCTLLTLAASERAGLHFDCVVESSGSVGGLEFAAEIVRDQKLCTVIAVLVWHP